MSVKSIMVALPAIAAAFAWSSSGVAQQQQHPSHGQQPAGGSVANDVKKANQEADSAADRANRQVVGDDQQNKNNAAAANPPPAKVNDNRTTPTAQSAGRTTTKIVDSLEKAGRDVTEATDHPGHYDPFSIELSPLGLFSGGRVSFNLEWVPVTHHAIVISPHIIHTSADIAVNGGTTTSQSFTGTGGELGYRYYTGHSGMNGVFLGPSLIAGVFNAGLPDGDQPFTNLGVAFDLGVQEIFWNHFVVGAGVGIEYLSVSHDFHDLPSGPSAIASSGVKPRLLLAAGYGF